MPSDSVGINSQHCSYKNDFLNCIKVLSGTKWVSNKWFHMDGQELARPCDLNPIKRNDYL